MYRADYIGKRRDKSKTSCDCASFRRIHAGAVWFGRTADEIKYIQYLQLYIEPVFWFDDPYGDL